MVSEDKKNVTSLKKQITQLEKDLRDPAFTKALDFECQRDGLIKQLT
jgi:predicted P-loop ATPase